MKLKILGKIFEISYEFVGCKEDKSYQPNKPIYRQHFKIKVKHGRKEIEYDFWATSLSLESREVGNLDENDLIFAFYCLLDDASAGMYDFCDFIKEFGFNETGCCCEGYEAWKDCKKQLGRVLSLGIKREEIEDMINYMVCKYNI